MLYAGNGYGRLAWLLSSRLMSANRIFSAPRARLDGAGGRGRRGVLRLKNSSMSNFTLRDVADAKELKVCRSAQVLASRRKYVRPGILWPILILLWMASGQPGQLHKFIYFDF